MATVEVPPVPVTKPERLAALNSVDASVTLTIRLLMQGKVSDFFIFLFVIGKIQLWDVLRRFKYRFNSILVKYRWIGKSSFLDVLRRFKYRLDSLLDLILPTKLNFSDLLWKSIEMGHIAYQNDSHNIQNKMDDSETNPDVFLVIPENRLVRSCL